MGVRLGNILHTLGVLALALILTACATTGGGGSGPSGTGVVMSIAESEIGSRTGSIVGAIGGAVIGSVIGGQIGSGLGRTVAATTASIGGSMAGSALGSRAAADHVWDVTVRFADGIDRDILEPSVALAVRHPRRPAEQGGQLALGPPPCSFRPAPRPPRCAWSSPCRAAQSCRPAPAASRR